MKKLYTLADAPINSADEDILHYNPYAEKIKKLIQFNSSNPNPITIGIYGEWGQGKSSFLNLIEKQIDIFQKEQDDKGIIKYHFNPWMYGTKDEMLFEFLDGLANTLYLKKKTNLQVAGEKILQYSKYLKCVKISASAGIPFTTEGKVTVDPSKLFEALGEDLRGDEITVIDLKTKIDDLLEAYHNKIVVFIDDLDRLDKDEIYTLLKIIKVNADFKNLVYIVTLDKHQVAKAIKDRYGDDQKDGELFLEKIINIPVYLPKIEDVDIKEYFDTKLEQIRVSLYQEETKKIKEFQQISSDYFYMEFQKPREIIRILNSFFVGAFAIGEEVNLYDLFWIEYLKLKHKGCYDLLKGYSISNSIEMPSNIVKLNDQPGENNEINGLRLKLRENHSDAFFIINRLFPTEARFQRTSVQQVDLNFNQLKINHPLHFDKYFSYHTKHKVSRVEIRQINKLIIENQKDQAEESILKFIENHEPRFIVFEFGQLLSSYGAQASIKLLMDLLLTHIEKIPHGEKNVFALSFREQLLDSLAISLHRINIQEPDQDIIEYLKNLSLDNLDFFASKYDPDRQNEVINNLHYDKIKSYEIIDLLKEAPEWYYVIRSLYCWKVVNEADFMESITEVLNSKESFDLLIRNFANYTYSTTNFFSPIDEGKYNQLNGLISVQDLVYPKIEEYYPEIASIENIDPEGWSIRNESSLEDNIKQIVFYYRQRQNA